MRMFLDHKSYIGYKAVEKITLFVCRWVAADHATVCPFYLCGSSAIISYSHGIEKFPLCDSFSRPRYKCMT